MIKYAIGLLAALSANVGLAETQDTILADQPFISKPWANGDYYTVSLALDGCLLSKTVVEFDENDTAEDSIRIDIDLAQIDTSRLDVVTGSVNLWGADGYEVLCTDISGSDCVMPNRPGESITIPESIAEEDYASAMASMIKSCQ